MLTLIHSRELTFIEGRLYSNPPPANLSLYSDQERIFVNVLGDKWRYSMLPTLIIVLHITLPRFHLRHVVQQLKIDVLYTELKYVVNSFDLGVIPTGALLPNYGHVNADRILFTFFTTKFTCDDLCPDILQVNPHYLSLMLTKGSSSHSAGWGTHIHSPASSG